MPIEKLNENGGGAGGAKQASSDLRALLMVGGATKGGSLARGGPPSGGGGRQHSHRHQKRPLLAYDREILLAIEKNSASRTRPEFLDPEYDTSHTPPRWDPDRWHAGTKPKSRSNKNEGPGQKTVGDQGGGGLGGLTGRKDDNWRKAKEKRPTGSVPDDEFDRNDQEEVRLGPMRRSYKEGCKPGNTPQEEPPSLRPKRGTGNGPDSDRRGRNGGMETSGEKWRPSSRREQQDDDKFRDFRSDPKPGYQRYNASDKFGGSSNNNRGYNRGNHHGRYHDNDYEEEEPEWMTEGADTMYDVLNLDDCRLPEHAKALESSTPSSAPDNRGGGRSASPELVAFDMGNFGKSGGGLGGLEDELGGGLEDNASPRHPGAGGLQDFNSKELDDLLDQVDIGDEVDLLADPFKQDSDEDTRDGESRFISFINKQEPNLHPHPPTNQSARLSNIWDRAPPSLQQMVPPQIPNIQQHRPPQQPPVADPSILEMRGIQGFPPFQGGAARPPPGGPPSGQNPNMPSRQVMPVRPPPPPLGHPPGGGVMGGGILPGHPPSGPPPGHQIMSLEELEGRASGPSPSGGSDPRPDVKAKLLNLTRQKNDFETKSNMQRMMLLQHQKPAPPMVYPKAVPNSFGLGDGIRLGNGMSGGVGSIPQQVGVPQQPTQGDKQAEIYEYLMNEKMRRRLTPSEEKFWEKHSQQALQEEIKMKMAMMDPRHGPSGGGGVGRPGPHHGPGPALRGGPPGVVHIQNHQNGIDPHSGPHLGHNQGPPPQHSHGHGPPPQNRNKGISLDRQKAQFDHFSGSKNGEKGSSLTAFMPTSVMRKMVKNRDDGSSDPSGAGRSGSGPGGPGGRHGKITPLEHTGVLRVPKSQDPRKPKNNQVPQPPQQQNRNLIQQNFPPLNPAQQQQGVRGVAPGNGSGSVPPFMLQQMILQQQMTQRPVMTSQMTSQDMMRPHPGPYDENQHIQKLLNQNKYHQDF